MTFQDSLHRRGITILMVGCLMGLVLFTNSFRDERVGENPFDTVRDERLFAGNASEPHKFRDRNTTSQIIGNYRPFETDGNCSVRLSTDFSLRPSRDNNTRPKLERCSLHHFDEYFLETGQFYGDGSWYSRPRGKPGIDVEFAPDICTFPPLSKSTSTFSNCLRKRNINSILITGDSNGRHIKDNAIEILGMAGYQCKSIRVSFKEETETQTDTHYFDVPDVPHYKLHFNACGFSSLACASEKYECSVNDNVTSHVLYVEYIALFHIIDESLTMLYSHRGEFEARLKSAESTLEYVLKYYFPHHGFPDIWIYSPPFHHEAWSSSLDKIHLSITYMLRLVQMYLPNTTEVVFMGDATECPTKRPPQIKEMFESFWNVSRIERIHEMNQVFYSLLISEVARYENYHVYFDATRLSCPIMCTWHKDGAHLLEVWYLKIAEYVLDIICSV